MSRRPPIPLLLGFSASLLLVGLSQRAQAHTAPHHSSGGGGEADRCIRWEKVPADLAPADDAGMSAPADMQGADMGPPADMNAVGLHLGERCAEYASLFGCSVAAGTGRAGSGGADGGRWGLVLAGALVVGLRLRHRSARAEQRRA